MRKHQTTWKRILQIVVAGVISLFLGRAVVQSWELVAAYEWDVRYLFLVISFVVLCFVFFCTALVWWLMTRPFVRNLGWKSGVSLFAKTQLAKYLPGKVGQPLALAYLLNREGVPRNKSFLAVVAFPVLALVSALVVASVFLGVSSMPRRYWYAWVIALVVLVALHPRILQWAFSLVRREVEIDYSYGRILLVVLLMAVVQVMAGVGFFSFVIAVHPVGIDRLPIAVGSFALAYSVGLLTFVSPAGLGVREGVLVFAMKGEMLPAFLTVIVIGFRLLTISSDVFCVGMTRILSRRLLVL